MNTEEQRSASCWRLRFVSLLSTTSPGSKTCHSRAAWERQRSPDPSPRSSPRPTPTSVLDQNMTSLTWPSPCHMTLNSPNGTFFFSAALLPSGHGLRRWAVLCKYDLVGANVDPGRMALKHVPGLPCEQHFVGFCKSEFQAIMKRVVWWFHIFEEKI